MAFLNKYILNDSDNWIIDKDILRLLLYEIEKYTSDNMDNLKGNLGEVYVAECLKRQLYRYGFRYSYKSEPMTFRIRYQYPKRNGIDIYLRVVDDKGKVYRIFIEVCNWGKYHQINEYMYLTRIQFKFFKWDSLERCYHVICMNRRNVKHIKEFAKRHNVHIIPLREHITPEFVQRIEEKNMASKEWIDGYITGRKG